MNVSNLFIKACRERKFDIVDQFFDNVDIETLLESRLEFEPTIIACWWDSITDTWISGNQNLLDENIKFLEKIENKIDELYIKFCKEGQYNFVSIINKKYIIDGEIQEECIKNVLKKEKIDVNDMDAVHDMFDCLGVSPNSFEYEILVKV